MANKSNPPVNNFSYLFIGRLLSKPFKVIPCQNSAPSSLSCSTKGRAWVSNISHNWRYDVIISKIKIKIQLGPVHTGRYPTPRQWYKQEPLWSSVFNVRVEEWRADQLALHGPKSNWNSAHRLAKISRRSGGGNGLGVILVSLYFFGQVFNALFQIPKTTYVLIKKTTYKYGVNSRTLTFDFLVHTDTFVPSLSLIVLPISRPWRCDSPSETPSYNFSFSIPNYFLSFELQLAQQKKIPSERLEANFSASKSDCKLQTWDSHPWFRIHSIISAWFFFVVKILLLDKNCPNKNS